MTTSARLFTAWWPDDSLRARLAAERERWQWPKHAQIVRAERLHLTLHFIGDVERERVAALRRVLAGVPVPEPIALELDRAEVWRNGVAALCASRAPVPLATLHAAIGAALAGVGVEIERRAWRPHVTLARRATQAQPPAAAPALRWQGDAFVLVESVLGVTARYEVLERYPRP